MDTIGFDIDGVLYDIHTAAYTELIAFHGLTIPFSKFWGNYKSYYSEKFYNSFFKIPILYDSMLPISGSIETLNYLAGKYNLCYITARPQEVKYVTKKWLKTNKFPYYENVEFSKNKEVEIRSNNCKYFIEDCWVQDKVDSMSKITNLILVNAVYNRDIINVPKIRLISELKLLL